MVKEILNKLTNFENLSEEKVKNLFNLIMEGKLTDTQIGAILTALKMKGETIEEITAAANVMRQKAVKVPIKDKSKLVDTCGTGGDKVNTFNVSTISAFVVAGAGAKVAKHGNRSVSSKCGSADIMQALGVNIEMPPEVASKALEEIGIAFLFAPIYHPAMKNVIKQRRELGIRTIFNILGPLSNPAEAKYQLMGVFSEKLVEPLARVLSNLGIERGFVVHGLEGLDEVSITTKTFVAEINNGEISTYYVEPEDFGLRKANLSDIEGGDLECNLDIALKVLKGEDKGAKTDFVALNSGFALRASGIVDTIKEGVELAKETIYSGKAYDVLEKLKNLNT
ncbi:MAG TPA: anthranilate phosphoribosyltransferase [Hydrogenothermaceae bacterium]|nr:anthranilate phosphoribosyltransferase [Hydrogenothermaceae bacterium]